MLPHWIRTADFTGGNTVGFIPGGSPFFEALERCIGSAQRTLHVQVYIFNADTTGMRILELLKAAVRRGVQVFLMVDAFGSSGLDASTIRDIRGSGIHFQFFGRFFSRNLSVGRRLHHKVVVADGHTFFVGGMNIADRYNDFPGDRSWLDFAVQVTGPLAQQAQNRCERLWLHKRWRRVKIDGKGFAPVLVRLRVNDWLRGKYEVTAGIRHAVRNARSSIVIAAAYFVPPRWMMAELQKAAQRGVRIRILLGHTSDVLLAEMATRYLYDWMLKNRFELFEWLPDVMHAKAIMVDDAWVSLGSYNLNFLSMYESVELNVEIADTEFAGRLSQYMAHIMETECALVTAQTNPSQRSWWRKKADWMAYVILWLLAHFFFFLDKKTFRPKHEPGPGV